MAPIKMRAATAAICASLLPLTVAANSLPRATTGTISVSLYSDSNHLGYYTNISIGTPPQEVQVLVDTGSADLWIYSNHVNCTPSDACVGSAFNSAASSSFKEVSQGGFLTSYAGGNGAEGDYISETVQIGGATVNNVIMGLATQAGSPNGLPISGIMGLGMLLDEALRSENAQGYFNLPYRLTAEHIINEAVFSVYLDDISSSTSTLLFGGIDTTKYTGPLAVFDVTPGPYGLIEYSLPVTAMTLVGSAGNSTSLSMSSSSGFSALLDTGSTAMSLPASLVEQIYNAYPIAETNAGPIVNCGLGSSGEKIAFQFGGSSGPTLTVSLAEIVRKSDLIENPDVCFFDIYPASQGEQSVLGDSFLRSVYAVFDPSNAQIGLAQANLDSNGNSVEALSAPAPVPTQEAIEADAQLGNGATYGGGIPGSVIGSQFSAVATAPASAAVVMQTSAAVKTTLATGASAVSVFGSAPATSVMASNALPKASSTVAAIPTYGTDPAYTATPTAAIPKYSGAAVAAATPDFLSIIGAFMGLLALS